MRTLKTPDEIEIEVLRNRKPMLDFEHQLIINDHGK